MNLRFLKPKPAVSHDSVSMPGQTAPPPEKPWCSSTPARLPGHRDLERHRTEQFFSKQSPSAPSQVFSARLRAKSPQWEGIFAGFNINPAVPRAFCFPLAEKEWALSASFPQHIPINFCWLYGSRCSRGWCSGLTDWTAAGCILHLFLIPHRCKTEKSQREKSRFGEGKLPFRTQKMQARLCMSNTMTPKPGFSKMLPWWKLNGHFFKDNQQTETLLDKEKGEVLRTLYHSSLPQQPVKMLFPLKNPGQFH